MFTRGAWKLATFPSRSLSIPPPSSLPRHSSSSSSSPNYDWLQEHNLSLSFHSNNQVGLLTLCRPDRRNALSPEMGKGIMKIASNPPSNLRALVVTGEGPVFSAGRDLKASLQHTPEETEEYMHISADSVGALKGCSIPTIAAIHGAAFGWGLELALACDLRVVNRDSVLCFPETSLGIFPGALGTVMLPRLVGPSVAKDLILTARKINGDEALSIKMVNRVSDSPQETQEEALALATTISKNAPLGIKGARKVIDEGLDLDFKDHVALSAAHRFPLNYTDDFKEALQAFRDKRKASFKGT